PRSLGYIPQTAWNQYRPDWIITHDQARDPQFPKEAQIMGGTYELDGVFPYAGPVGWHWATYRLRLP
ncbi:MAG: hypothetical protein JWN70_7233, partial [Planctomycetaceae bacterium]|nr:hypothetical protein [Planctomycetaceae bacterium]